MRHYPYWIYFEHRFWQRIVTRSPCVQREQARTAGIQSMFVWGGEAAWHQMLLYNARICRNTDDGAKLYSKIWKVGGFLASIGHIQSRNVCIEFKCRGLSDGYCDSFT